ncbi:hypothetical protein Syun_016744 [Stephania yunnanensis]|uniref:non-specific serine/threonine protein kinase n=1 Tax=Stephania yunnanensis TaxID=152371 RepID=A0AAP0J5C4_9MAGN
MMMGVRVLLSLIIISSMKFGNSEAVIQRIGVGDETDKVSLLAFKQGISNDPLGVLSSWNDSSSNFCKWQGVVCGRRHRRVTALELPEKSLVGLISPSLGNLSFLRSINLGNNSFYGRIPQEISQLHRLRHLILPNNSLGGDIPSNLSQCFHLQELDLSENHLEGKIPAELGGLAELQRLALKLNNLTGGIPQALGNLSSLKIMSVAYNSLEGSIPDTIAQLTRLKFISAMANKFSGTLPPMLFNISSLNAVTMTSNQFRGNIPIDIGPLPSLTFLALGDNQFSGTIPESLSNITGLQVLDLGMNNFVGQVPTNLGLGQQSLNWLGLDNNHLGSGGEGDLNFITSLSNCKSLDTLQINDNRFGGVLPDSISNLTTQLTILILGRNQIHGRIPTGIRNLINLHRLGMENNFFTGSIPSSLGKLQNLEELVLYDNRLTGRIPYSLGNITQLLKMSLSTNRLEGPIPSSLGQCSNLQVLDLSQNNLSGTIPKEVFLGLSSLSMALDVSENALTGPLPAEVGNLKKLGIFKASHNNLNGEIPHMLSRCESLEHLALRDNLFVGEIPTTLNALKAISDMDLSQNNLSGAIPKYLESLPLVNLNLSFNKLEGEVPKGGVFRNSSRVALGGNEHLCGGILELHLPGCSTRNKRGRNLHLKLIIIVITSVATILFILLVALISFRARTKRKMPSTPSMDKFSKMKVSYDDLFKATDGFSSANLIGSGSFGLVYKGVLNQGETVVAVKVLKLQQRGATKTFKAECKALRNVRHRNLVKIVSSCSSIDSKGNDFKALVFEFMPNGSLEQWLHQSFEDEHSQSRQLSLTKRINILIDVASALDYLHHHCHTRIIHCDLKPSNILLDDDMTAHVSDFGIARLFSETNQNFSFTRSSSIGLKGSIGYAAPEYGIGGVASTQGDVYSFGIVLLEMVVGRRPTDEIFKDGLNLHIFAKMALPEQVMRVVDRSLLIMTEKKMTEEEGTSKRRACDRRDKMQECTLGLVRIGVECSMEAPRERMDMKDVIKELHLIRKTLLDVGIN